MMMRVSNYSDQGKARRDGKQAHAQAQASINNQADVAQQKKENGGKARPRNA
jgi:hypothetical protein